MNGIFTIGYEGAALEDFIATLQLMNIDVLLDVRELPISRRKGFSKNKLREALGARGIAYRHEKALGSPKPVRDKLKSDKDYDTFFRKYGEHLDAQRELLQVLVEELSGNVVLMCYERNVSECHRFAVAVALQELTGVSPRHLGVQNHEQRTAVQRKNLGSG